MSVSPSSRRSIVLLLALVCGFTLLGVWFSHHERASREDVFEASPGTNADQGEPDAPVLDSPRAEASAAARTATGGGDSARLLPAKDGVYSVRGRVLDLLGRPVADAAITTDVVDPTDARVLAKSDERGLYAFDTNQLEGVLAASTPELRTLRTHVWHSQSDADGLIVVAPCADLHGTVVDEQQTGVKRARVRIELPEDLLAGFPADTSRTSPSQAWSVSCDEAGRFALRRAYTAPGARILVTASGYVPAREAVPADTRRPLQIVLAHDPEANASRITGDVKRVDGTPAEAAVVWFGDARVGCDGEGRFSLAVDAERARDEWALIAFEMGAQAAVVPQFGKVVRRGADEIPVQHLVLGGTVLSIRGQVLDDHGEPLADCTVALLDPGVASELSTPPTTVEELASGMPGMQRTDAQGAFTLGGLFERDYHLQVVDEKRLGRLEAGPFRAGANDVVVRFPPDALIEELRGRVVGRDGTPIEGVQVNVMVETSRIGSNWAAAGREPRKTGPDGEFVFTNVPRRNADLQLSAPGIVNKTIDVETLPTSGPVDVVVDRYCPVRFAGLENATTPQWIGAVDAEGRELMVFRDSGNRRSGSNRIQLGDDSAQVYLVSEAVTEFVRYAPYDSAIARRTVQVIPNEVRIVSW